jgi:hypothetical protein
MTRIRVFVAVGCLAVFAAACGGGAKDNGIAKLSAKQALARVQAAFNSVSSLHMTGTIHASGKRITLDVHVAKGRGTGTLTVGGGRLDVRLVGGEAYARGTGGALSALGANQSQASLVANRWLKSSASGGQFASFTQFLDLSAIRKSALTPQGTVTTGGSVTVAGTKALKLVDSAGAATLFVAETGKPLPLKLAKNGADGGELDFSDYNGSVNVPVPAGAIDLSTLGG